MQPLSTTQLDLDGAALLSFVDTKAYQDTVGLWISTLKESYARDAAFAQSEKDIYRMQGAWRALDELEFNIKSAIEGHLQRDAARANKLLTKED